MAEGLSGGLAGLVLFILVLRRSFGAIGKSRKLVEGYRDEWLFWSLGAALFAHVIVFMGLDYFDQTRSLWTIFLAMISTATLGVKSMANKPAPVSQKAVADSWQTGPGTAALDEVYW